MTHANIKNIILLVAGCLIMIAYDRANGYTHTKHVTIRPRTINNENFAFWTTNLNPMESAFFSVTIIKQAHGYQLKSGPTVAPAVGDLVVWEPTGIQENQSSIEIGFSVINTSPETSSTHVYVSCVWEPIPGGEGPGPRPPDIEGWALGQVLLDVGRISWGFSSTLQPVGTLTPIAYTVSLTDNKDNIFYPNPASYFYLSEHSLNPEVELDIFPDSGWGPTLVGDVTSTNATGGYLKLEYSYFGHAKTAISPRVTFMGINKMRYQRHEGASWYDVPEQIYAAKGTNINFRLNRTPSFGPWPDGMPVWINADGTNGNATATFDQVGTRYIKAECGNVVTAKVVTLNVDIEQTEEYFCWQSTNASLNLTDSFLGDGNATWKSEPTGISGEGNNITFNPNNLAPTTYVVTAYASLYTNCFDTCTVTVVKVELDASKNLLTLKHDRECNLEVKTTPATEITFDKFRIDIKRTNSTTWYVLSTNKMMTPWLANTAGGFYLRGMARIGETECYSTNIVIVSQFPTYAQITGDTNVQSRTETEWQSTLNDCIEEPNQRRERGFWIRINTADDAYEYGTTVIGPWAGPEEGATIDLGARPADIPSNPLPNSTGATYSVASFHTHTPYTYLSTDYWRLVGPSEADHSADAADDVTGIVYDYIGDEHGGIWGGHPKDSPAQRYHSGPMRRSTP